MKTIIIVVLSIVAIVAILATLDYYKFHKILNKDEEDKPKPFIGVDQSISTSTLETMPTVINIKDAKAITDASKPTTKTKTLRVA